MVVKQLKMLWKQKTRRIRKVGAILRCPPLIKTKKLWKPRRLPCLQTVLQRPMQSQLRRRWLKQNEDQGKSKWLVELWKDSSLFSQKYHILKTPKLHWSIYFAGDLFVLKTRLVCSITSEIFAGHLWKKEINEPLRPTFLWTNGNVSCQKQNSWRLPGWADTLSHGIRVMWPNINEFLAKQFSWPKFSSAFWQGTQGAPD